MMTNDEKKMLRDLHEAFCKPMPGSKKTLLEELTDLHNELFRKDPATGKSLFQEISAVVLAFNRWGWLGRFAIWGFLTVGSIVVAWDKIVVFFKGTSE